VEEQEGILRVVRQVAPGTPLREGLESILHARTGALIVVGDSPEVMALVDGGFRLDCEFTPASLYELAKMDGAIILTRDARRILCANAMLVPDASIPTSETGTRHRTAERVAKQTGELVISISQRRSLITLYQGSVKHIVRDFPVILAKTNQALQTLEKYKLVRDEAVDRLSALELDDMVSVQDVAMVIQRTEMVLRVGAEIERYIAELGVEGRLVAMQLEELTAGVAAEELLILRDYAAISDPGYAEALRAQLASWPYDMLQDLTAIARLLGAGTLPGSLESPIAPRGYRMLRRIPRLPAGVIENLVTQFDRLQGVLRASLEELDEVDGIGEVRARAIREGLHRLRERSTPLRGRHAPAPPPP